MPAKKSAKKSSKKSAKKTSKKVATKKISKKTSKKMPSKITIVKDSRRRVNWVLTLIISLLFGVLGIDRFMMGKVGTGLLKLVTFGGLGIWYIVDVILIATKYEFKNIRWVD